MVSRDGGLGLDPSEPGPAPQLAASLPCPQHRQKRRCGRPERRRTRGEVVLLGPVLGDELERLPDGGGVVKLSTRTRAISCRPMTPSAGVSLWWMSPWRGAIRSWSSSWGWRKLNGCGRDYRVDGVPLAVAGSVAQLPRSASASAEGEPGSGRYVAMTIPSLDAQCYTAAPGRSVVDPAEPSAERGTEPWKSRTHKTK